jgi:hypothetical protein
MKTRAISLVRLMFCLVLIPAIYAAEVPGGIWAKIYSSDIPTYAANLRAAGVPEATLGLLVSQEINARFKAREQALEPSLTSLQTLKEGWSAERREALVQLKREKNDLLRATLGAVPNETAKLEVISPSLASANPGKRELVRLILEDYQAMKARVSTESRGFFLEEDKAKLSYLEDELYLDLAKALGPEIALDYQIERDSFMRAVQQRLELFKPTRLELRDIFTARRNSGMDIAARNPNGGNRLAELQKATLVELEKRWGPERYAEYARLASLIYQQSYHLVRRLGLPLEIADQLFDSRKAMVEKGWKLHEQVVGKGPVIRVSGSPGTRPLLPSEFMKQAVAEHCELAKRLLGEAGYQEYYGLNSGWIQSILEKGSITNPDMFERTLPL